MNYFIKKMTGKSTSQASSCCGVEIKEVENVKDESCCGTSNNETSCCS